MHTIYFRKLSPIVYSVFFGYVLLLVFFNTLDIYHNYFFTTGPIVVVYNVMRLAFIFYLMWLFYIVGNHVLASVSEKTYHSLAPLESALVAFFAGVGVWHIVLLFVGFAGLYNRTLMAAITLIIFIASLPKLDSWFRYAKEHKGSIYWSGCVMLAIPVSAFFIAKGLYPGGGHDYFTHYFSFYRKVTESGSILPNEVWYHFYYSKGAGLFFLSILLTDLLAPQLATSAMILAGAAIVFSILNKKGIWRLLPWIGASLYVTFLIYTPGSLKYWRHGGWGELEKLHEPTAVLVLAILWQTINLARSNCRVWGFTLILTVSGLIILNPAISLFIGVYLSAVTLYFFIIRNKQAALWAVLSVAAIAMFLFFLLSVNYFLTGLPDDKVIFAFWPAINFDKIKEWGVTLELLMLHNGKTGMVAMQLPLIKLPAKLAPYLRFDMWGSVFFFPLFLFCLALFKQKWRRFLFERIDKISLLACGGFLLLILLVSILVGRDQPVSYYRFTSFTYAPMLCVCLLVLSSALFNSTTKYVFVISGCLATWLILTMEPSFHGIRMIHSVKEHDHISDLKAIMKNGILFATGQYSISDAYRHQNGRPDRMYYGAIYPAAEVIWSKLPRSTRIWSMSNQSYCMLPDCHMEGFMSFRFSSHGETVYFGTPQEAKKLLQKENLNYFFISNSLRWNDPLPRSPLFSPQNISQFFGIAWTDGDNTLLTWKEFSSLPIGPVWVNLYKKKISKASIVNTFPYNETKMVFDILKVENKVKASEIPWNAK
jgi:hypothetical protein